MARSSHGPKRDIGGEITAKIIARIEGGEDLPWRRPWRCSALAQPLRSTGEAYRGINTLLLSLETFDRGFTSPFWMTYNQARTLEAQVRKGETSTQVVYYGTARKKGADAVVTESESGDDTYRFLKGFRVFNVCQIDGLSDQFFPVEDDLDTGARSIEPLDALLRSVGVPILDGGNRAAYRELTDDIIIPEVSRFETAERYIAVGAHELIHATGIKSRLGRTCFADYHTDLAIRAEEELVAELGSAFFCAPMGITPHHIDDHAAYLKSWLKRLKNDTRFIFKAAAQAQRACDWLTAKADMSLIERQRETAVAA